MGCFRHLPSHAACSSPSATGAHGLPGPAPSYLDASLLDARFDSDSCGVGLVAQLSAESSREILRHAVRALGELPHRGAVAADGKSSDGLAVTAAIPREWLRGAAGLTHA